MLQGLLPAQPPSALDALFAMWSGADPGYRGNNFSATANDLVQTRLAADNNPSLLPAFTTEEVLGAARVFTPSNVAVAMPVTDASNIVDYGFRGVSAAPSTTVVSLPASSADPWTLGPDPVLDPITSVVKVCFPAGTPIFMPDGTVKLVEQIAKRDGVNAASDRDPEGPISTGEVVELIRNGPSALIAVEFAGRVIKATPRHPFYVFGRGFIPAEELAPGDLLRTASGAKVAVTSVTPGGHADRVYNFQVRDLHTYFVGDSAETAVLVHNDDCASAPDNSNAAHLDGWAGIVRSLPYTGSLDLPGIPNPDRLGQEFAKSMVSGALSTAAEEETIRARVLGKDYNGAAKSAFGFFGGALRDSSVFSLQANSERMIRTAVAKLDGASTRKLPHSSAHSW